jgi:hypothetical protein
MDIDVSRSKLLASVVAAATVLSVASPAQAATTGQTVFYTGTDFTGAPREVSHVSCDSTVVLLLGQYSSMENRPPTGCKVQLYANVTRAWVTLCVGRGPVPVQVRLNPEVRVVPGSAAHCA